MRETLEVVKQVMTEVQERFAAIYGVCLGFPTTSVFALSVVVLCSIGPQYSYPRRHALSSALTRVRIVHTDERFSEDETLFIEEGGEFLNFEFVVFHIVFRPIIIGISKGHTRNNQIRFGYSKFRPEQRILQGPDLLSTGIKPSGPRGKHYALEETAVTNET